MPLYARAPKIGLDGSAALSRSFVVGEDHAERPGACFSGEPRAELRIGDAPGEDQVQRSLKVLRVLDEERPLLGKEDLEPLVHRDLRLVRLHLAEVGIDRSVEDQALAKDQLRIEADAGVGEIPLFESRERTIHSIGNELHVPARFHPFHLDAARLREKAVDAGRGLRPERPVARMRAPSLEEEPPGLPGSVGKSYALEGEGEPDHEPAIGPLAFRIPERVESAVDLSALDEERVELHAEGVGAELVAAALVVEGVEIHIDEIVVAIHALPPGETRPHLLRLVVEGDEDDVEVLVVIAEIDVGGLRRRGAVARRPLLEAGEAGHAAFQPTARLHVEEVLERRRDLDPLDLDGRPRRDEILSAGEGGREQKRRDSEREGRIRTGMQQKVGSDSTLL